ncbi:hypothetical protein ACHWQZ_G002190 [Mnemiopsis leidyi]
MDKRRAAFQEQKPLCDWSKQPRAQIYFADEERLAALFYKLDYYKDGHVTVEELEKYLEEKEMKVTRDEIEAIIERGDIRKDGKLDYQEFMLFMLEHERDLWEHFVELDHDGSGQISYSELKLYCEKNGIDIPSEILQDHLNRLDKDGNLHISWDEFREFNQFKIRYDLVSATKLFGSAYVDGIIDQIPETQKHGGGWYWSGVLKQILCGGVAGVVSRTCTAPIDRAKVLLQVQGQQQVVGCTGSGQSLNARQMVTAMWREGIFTMWKGNLVNCLKIFPENAIRLFIFERLNESQCLTRNRMWNIRGNTVNKFANGAVTGMIVQTIMYPVEIIKTRIMTLPSGSGKMGVRDAFIKIWNEKENARPLKILNFYKGFLPAVVGVMPFAAIELGCSRLATDAYKDHFGIKHPGWSALLGIGTVSTFTAMGCTYPFRLITCRMQAYTGPEKDRLSGSGHFNKIRKTEGLKGFYRGFAANSCKAVPSSALAWGVYHKAQRYWDIGERYLYS